MSETLSKARTHASSRGITQLLTLYSSHDRHGIELPDDYFTNPRPPSIEMPSWMNNNTSSERVRLRRQLMILLYVESMLYILSKRLGKLVKHSDSLVRSGKLGKRRLIFPGIKRLRKWVSSTLQEEDIDRDHFSDSFSGTFLAYNPAQRRHVCEDGMSET